MGERLLRVMGAHLTRIDLTDLYMTSSWEQCYTPQPIKVPGTIVLPTLQRIFPYPVHKTSFHSHIHIGFSGCVEFYILVIKAFEDVI